MLAGSTAYTLAEAFTWDEGLLGHAPSRTADSTRVLVASMLGGVVIGLVGVDPIRGLYYAAILNGLAAPPLIVLMLIQARDRRLCGSYTSKRLSTVLLTVAVGVSVALPLCYLLAS